MAAGRGTRISRLTDGKPKSCLKINDEPLIKQSLRILKSKGFSEIGIVTGFESVYLREVINDTTIKFYHNPFFSVTNSIVSLWFAQELIDSTQDLYIMNADLFFDEHLLDDLFHSKKNVTMLSDSARVEGADYKFNWKGDKLLKFGKELTVEETTGEYIGIGKISKSFRNKFKTRMNEMIHDGNINSWWEDVAYDFVRSNDQEINILDVKGKHFWAEVDYIEDYNRILEYVNSKK